MKGGLPADCEMRIANERVDVDEEMAASQVSLHFKLHIGMAGDLDAG